MKQPGLFCLMLQECCPNLDLLADVDYMDPERIRLEVPRLRILDADPAVELEAQRRIAALKSDYTALLEAENKARHVLLPEVASGHEEVALVEADEVVEEEGVLEFRPEMPLAFIPFKGGRRPRPEVREEPAPDQGVMFESRNTKQKRRKIKP